MPITFRLVPGVIPSVRRGVGFLEGHSELGAGFEFDELDVSDTFSLKSRMDHWVAGNDSPSKYFHGFKSGRDYRECFVFKLPERRWYGFLCHPRPQTNPSFLLCVLCIHASKHEHETDLAELDRVNGWRTSTGATEAISETYPEYKKRSTGWKS